MWRAVPLVISAAMSDKYFMAKLSKTLLDAMKVWRKAEFDYTVLKSEDQELVNPVDMITCT